MPRGNLTADGSGNEPLPRHENGQCVTPLVKRHKNDMADAEAICEAAQRPTMRFVAVKTKEQQARGMLFHTRDLLVRQRTQTINALRGHLAEFGVVAPQGDRLMSIGWHRPSRVQVQGCQDRSVSWAPFCSIGSRTSMRRSTD